MPKEFIWLTALLASWAAVAAASMVPRTTGDLARSATLVIAGTVEDVTSYPPDGSGIIYSEASVRVRDTAVGAIAAEYVTVRYTGGEYGGLALAVLEEPTFEAGEEVVLFLAPLAEGVYKCPDGVQGKLSVVDGTVLTTGKTLNEFLTEVAAAAGR
jgi:hypothetical protein